MKIVLDTSFILPLFNVETNVFGKNDLSVLAKIGAIRLVPSPLLIEAKWVLYSLVRRKVLKDFDTAVRDFNDGLRFLLYRDVFRIVGLDADVDLLESKFFKVFGLRDYFDRVVLAVAKAYDAVLLTEDKSLLSLDISSHSDILPREIINWKTFKMNYVDSL